ncbi:MAG TPA: DNRLRE domain-containing protein [Parafilimonas sp.]|nr:DNRLRE domain-containing protein [Parafilimonas sp.]
MKRFNTPILCCVVISFVVCSCQKTPDSQPGSDNMASSNSAGKLSVASQTLSIRPGPGMGQDVYVYKEAGVKASNWNNVPELNASVWVTNGVEGRSSSFIRFDGLSKIPIAATVISAKLYLYGLPSSVSISQGNYGDNACFIRRVIDPWNEATLKYSKDGLPKSTTDGQAILPASTSQWNYNGVVDVTAMVAHMVGYPTENFGFSMSLVTPKKYRAIVFGSSEQSDRSLRPKLVVVYDSVSNPLAGTYLWNFHRWDAPDSASGYRADLSFDGESTVFSPLSASQIEVASGYYIQPRYEITFTNNGGLLTNFHVSLNADDLALMASAGVVVTAGPSIVWADPITKNFEFVYSVTAGGASYRYILDNYYNP